MDAFIEPLLAQLEFRELKERLHDEARIGVWELAGCIDSQKMHMAYWLGDQKDSRLIVTFTEQRAREFCEEYRFFDKSVRYFPSKDILFYQSDIRGNELERERVETLKLLSDGQGCTVVTTFDALMNRMAPPDGFLSVIRTLEAGARLDMWRRRGSLLCAEGFWTFMC